MGEYYFYDGNHGVSFWKLVYSSANGWQLPNNTPMHSWTEFKMIPFKRIEVDPPKINYMIYQLPGTNIRYDITDSLPGGKTKQSRTGNWTFAIPPDVVMDSWASVYNTLKDYFNGSRFVVSLDDEDSLYYKGRLQISAYSPGESYATVTIDYDLDANESDTLSA